jgi:hypothetical protein
MHYYTSSPRTRTYEKHETDVDIETINGYRGTDDVDELLKFIEGDAGDKKKNNKKKPVNKSAKTKGTKTKAGKAK